MTIDRRRFITTTAAAGIGFGAGSKGAVARVRAAAVQAGRSPDIVVVGAGTFGMWTALNLQRLGARVTVVDAYGAGNSRQTSGGETRGVRTSYGDRPHGRLWTRWANEAIRKWTAWDEMGRDRLLPRLFFNTGDLILREETSEYIENTRAHWDALGTTYEPLTADEVAYRWPWVRFENLGVALYEPAAGVVRARRAIESVARVFEEEGGTIRIGRAAIGARNGARLETVAVEGGEAISAETMVFACGPWFPKVFPRLMGNRIRISIGHVFYFAVPPGDTRFAFPNMPSYGVPGCTGWPALPPDHRGFRVRTGGRVGDDPDTSDRWIPAESHERPRQILERHFPDLVGAPINETRACHYESSVDRNFIVDHHPDFNNVWLLGGGSSEGFKFGPVLGEYIARRMLGVEDDPELAEGFRLKDEEFGSSGRRGRD
ncbi:MAG: FAD-binding oxidoreductase [Acidobacteriota bacterium]|nr:FAD-binding oxidoreductase [Acidobacteriota bacterium]